MAMRELPFGVNVTLEQEKIEIEKMREALVGSLQQMTQAIPQMAMQGQDPSNLVRQIADVIKARKKGISIEEAIEDVFTPENPPAGAAESVEQPVPSAPGEPPVGGAPGGAAMPPARPELQTLLSTMTGSGAARSSAQISNKRPR
jgi:hypothetical protein